MTEYTAKEAFAEASRHGDHVADMLTAYAERIATDEDVRVRFAKWAEENGYDVLSNDDLSAAAWHGYQSAHADLAGEVRELAEEVIEAINDGDAQSARNAAQAALDKFAHQEKDRD